MVGIRGPIHTHRILAKEWESEIDPSFLPGVQQWETLVHHESKSKEGARIVAHALNSTTLPAVFIVVGGEVQFHRIVAIYGIVFSCIDLKIINALVALAMSFIMWCNSQP